MYDDKFANIQSELVAEFNKTMQPYHVLSNRISAVEKSLGNNLSDRVETLEKSNKELTQEVARLLKIIQEREEREKRLNGNPGSSTDNPCKRRRCGSPPRGTQVLPECSSGMIYANFNKPEINSEITPQHDRLDEEDHIPEDDLSTSGSEGDLEINPDLHPGIDNLGLNGAMEVRGQFNNFLNEAMTLENGIRALRKRYMLMEEHNEFSNISQEEGEGDPRLLMAHQDILFDRRSRRGLMGNTLRQLQDLFFRNLNALSSMEWGDLGRGEHISRGLEMVLRKLISAYREAYWHTIILDVSGNDSDSTTRNDGEAIMRDTLNKI